MRRHSLKLRFISVIAAIYLVLGTLSLLAFHLTTNKIVRPLGSRFAGKQALLEKSKLISAIQRDLSLSLKMCDSPLLRQWALAEDDPAIKRQALAELESYRKNLKGQSVFFALERSRHYYFGDGTGERFPETPRYTLAPENPNDAWYFRTLRQVDDYELNVDYDNHLDTTKVWFNVAIKDEGGRKIGLAGSGIDITQFINEIIHSTDPGVETILLGADGAIEGHRDKRYVEHNSKVRGTQRKTTIYDLLGDATDRATLKTAIARLKAGGTEVDSFYLTMNGKRFLAAMAHLPEVKWFNLVLVDPAAVVSGRDFLPILLVTIASLLAVSVILGLLLNRLVLRPLSALAGSARQIAQGQFDVAMPVRSRDEIGALTHSFNEMARMVKDHSENLERLVAERTEALNATNAQLADSNRQILDSIRYAQMIQASILPETAAIERHAREFFALYRPRDIVGGDFYYFRECGAGGCVLAVVDCTGHGVPGAFMTMTAKAVLDHALDTLGGEEPAALLKALDRNLRAVLHASESPSAVATDNGLEIGLCAYQAATRQLKYAGARLDLHVVQGGRVHVLAGDRRPIGYRRNTADFTYTTQTVIVDATAMFYLASDGILDQSGGPRGWGFGRKRFGELLLALASQPAAEQEPALAQALAEYQGANAQRDDITVIGFRF